MQFPRLVIVSPALRDAERFVARPLLGEWKGRDAMPVEAVAEGRDGCGFRLARRELDRAAVEALVLTARKNVEATPWNWDVAEESGALWLKRPSLLRAVGTPRVSAKETATEGSWTDDFSSDLLLHPQAMAAAASRLGAASLLVSVPRRGWLLASAGKLGDTPVSAKLRAASDRIPCPGERHAISSAMVFQVTAGAMSGIDLMNGGSGYVSLRDPDPSAWLGA